MSLNESPAYAQTKDDAQESERDRDTVEEGDEHGPRWPVYDALVAWGSASKHEIELRCAREEYALRTGEIFESDANYETRIGAFLEWYLLDRPKTSSKEDGAFEAIPFDVGEGSALTPTPARRLLHWLLWHASKIKPQKEAPEPWYPNSVEESAHWRADLAGLASSRVSIFEFRRAKNQSWQVLDLLSGTTHNLFERRRAIGIQAGDLFEARLWMRGTQTMLLPNTVCLHPPAAYKAIRSACKKFAALGPQAYRSALRLNLVHRVAFLTNRCTRYRHLDPAAIFAPLRDSLEPWGEQEP